MSAEHKESIRRGLRIPGCKVLSKRFLRSNAHRQVHMVHRDRKSNALKVADFKRLVNEGSVNLRDGTLTHQDQGKLEQLGIKVPEKQQPPAPKAEPPDQGAPA